MDHTKFMKTVLSLGQDDIEEVFKDEPKLDDLLKIYEESRRTYFEYGNYHFVTLLGTSRCAKFYEYILKKMNQK